MKKSVLFLVIVCTIICISYIYAANCYHKCHDCGTSYSSPNKCVTPLCPAASGTESHWRKITHSGGSCEDCRKGLHSMNGTEHDKYSWPANCHQGFESN